MQQYANRLIGEQSPYLLQHANNPVDWHPWGEEAFEIARCARKPIFLSIGYATCHGCHVMGRESFEDERIAALMNETFVCIKVDREERPDIDNVYMAVCQMMTGQGGWPLNIVMTPERKPFFAATYIPPESRFGRPGMVELIPKLREAWEDHRGEVDLSADRIASVLLKQNPCSNGTRMNAKVLDVGYRELMEQMDPRYGGFGTRPKFPSPHRLVFLMRHGRKQGLAAVEKALLAMRMGGIFDHVGFGFHRYSTDERWLVPHFEKMLYDQAMLAMAYAEAYAMTGKPFYQQVAREVLTYVLRDMVSPDGGFYSAEDADSEGEEGRFYTWDAREMEEVLGEAFPMASSLWNVRSSGNVRDEAAGGMGGRNILHLGQWPDALEQAFLETCREKLFAVRQKRIHPLKDTKILADWNGLMIAAFAMAGRVFEEPVYIDAAKNACRFVERNMCRQDGMLWHRYRDGHVAVHGQLDDYAFMVSGLLELYEATLDSCHLESALRFNDRLSVWFSDIDGGGYYMTSKHAEKLIVRPKSIYDGVLPSGNGVQMYNLLRLARLTSRLELEQRAADTGQVFGSLIHRAPSACAQALIAFQYGAGKSTEIVVVGERECAETAKMLACASRTHIPGKVILFKDVNNPKSMNRIAPFTKRFEMRNGKATAYVCRNFACEEPVDSHQGLRDLLDLGRA